MDNSGLKAKGLPRVIAAILPGACIVLPLLAILGLFFAGRSDLVLSGMYLFIGTFLAGLVALFFPRPFQEELETEEPENPNKSNLNLLLLFVLLFIISIILLVQYDSRPLFYFILIAAMAGIILWQIMQNPGRLNTGIITGQMILLSINLAWGQTLKLPFYFGDGDLFSHFNWVGKIIGSGHVTNTIGDYQYFPLLHILNAQGTLLTGLDIPQNYFIVSSLMFATSILLAYLIVKLVTRNTTLGLISALIYTLSREFLHYEMYTLTRTMAFVICLLMLYLLLSEKHGFLNHLLAVCLIIPLVLTHQITLVIFAVILFLIIITGALSYRRWDRIGYSFLVLLTVTSLGYWLYLATSFFDAGFTQIMNIDNTISLPPSGELKLPWQAHLAGNLDYVIICLLVLLGVTAILRSSRPRDTLHIMAIVSLAGLFFFLPGPSNYILPATVAYRVPVMVLPFIALAAGAAIWFMMQQRLKDSPAGYASCFLGIILLVGYSFITPILLSGQTDTDLSGVLGRQNKKYFAQAELSAMNYTATNYSELAGLADITAEHYLSKYLGIQDAKSMTYRLDIDSIEEGFFLFRHREYASRGQLPFLYFEQGKRDMVVNYKNGIDDSAFSDWLSQNKVFVNNAATLYHTNKNNKEVNAVE